MRLLNHTAVGPRLSGLIALALASPAMAFVPWNDPSGNGAFFQWSNGGSENGYFGSPLLTHGGTTFTFFPAWHADAEDGQLSLVSDRMTVDLSALEGFGFHQFSLTQNFHYALTGGGASFQASLTGTITDVLHAGRITTRTFTTPTDLAGTGIFTFVTTFDLTGQPDWTALHLTLDQMFIVSAGAGGTAHVDAAVWTMQIPSAGTPALALLVIGAATRRRR